MRDKLAKCNHIERNNHILITLWSIIINCMLIIKWTFSLSHTMIYGGVVTIMLIWAVGYNRKIIIGISGLKNLLYLIKNEMNVGIWIIVFIGFTVSVAGVIHLELSNIALGLTIGILFPLIHIIVRENETSLYMQSMCFGTAIVFVGFALISIIFVPLSYTQYASIIGNPNELGQYLVFVIPSMLFLYDSSHKLRYILLADVAICFIIFSISRTSYVCVVAIIIVSIAYYLISEGMKNTLVSGMKNLILFCIVFFLIFGMMTTGNKALRDLEKVLFGQEYIFYAKLYKYDGTHVDLNDLGNYIGMRIIKGVEEEKEDGKAQKKTDIQEMSSGRTNIWHAFIVKVNFIGHQSDEWVYTKALGYTEDDAHNTYIDNAYYYGIISAIIMIGYIIYLARALIRESYIVIKKRKKNSEFYLRCGIFASFFITSMLASVFSPFHSSIAFGIWAICVYKKTDETVIE